MSDSKRVHGTEAFAAKRGGEKEWAFEAACLNGDGTQRSCDALRLQMFIFTVTTQVMRLPASTPAHLLCSLSHLFHHNFSLYRNVLFQDSHSKSR